MLPHPLRPPAEPRARAFVARYPQTNFTGSYNEGALFVGADYHGELGWYCLSMPVDDDTAMVCGREVHGFPKKMADRITLDRDGDHVVGSVVRRGEELIRIEGDFVDALAGAPPGDPRVTDPDGHSALKLVSFLFKYVPAADGDLFVHAPQLVRQVTLLRPWDGQRTGPVKLQLGATAFDPLGEVPVWEVTAASFGTWDNTMLPGRVVAKVYNQWRFAPKNMFKNDAYTYVDLDAQPALSLRERRRMTRKLRAY